AGLGRGQLLGLLQVRLDLLPALLGVLAGGLDRLLELGAQRLELAEALVQEVVFVFVGGHVVRLSGRGRVRVGLVTATLRGHREHTPRTVRRRGPYVWVREPRPQPVALNLPKTPPSASP